MARRKITAKEDLKIRHNVFDEFTNRTLYKLMTEGYFNGLESPLFIGKESNVFTALKKDGTRVIVKIYRLESCDFNRMYDYIKADPRYLSIKKKRRNIVFAWVQREYRNLMIAREHGVPVPLALAFMNNVLVLECVEFGGHVAPKLKDAAPYHPQDFFDKVVLGMKKLHKAGLVHADLSPFNILNRDESPIFIDFSQGTEYDSESGERYLERDVRNVCTFFSKLGIDSDEKKLKAEILTVKPET